TFFCRRGNSSCCASFSSIKNAAVKSFLLSSYQQQQQRSIINNLNNDLIPFSIDNRLYERLLNKNLFQLNQYTIYYYLNIKINDLNQYEIKRNYSYRTIDLLNETYQNILCYFIEQNHFISYDLYSNNLTFIIFIFNYIINKLFTTSLIRLKLCCNIIDFVCSFYYSYWPLSFTQNDIDPLISFINYDRIHNHLQQVY
ncbi:unnamed protein product, partial [Rotaria sp. Silwood1]